MDIVLLQEILLSQASAGRYVEPGLRGLNKLEDRHYVFFGHTVNVEIFALYIFPRNSRFVSARICTL